MYKKGKKGPCFVIVFKLPSVRTEGNYGNSPSRALALEDEEK